MTTHKPTQFIVDLARSFPCLATKIDAAMTRGWHPDRFDPDVFFEASAKWSGGEKQCAIFVLNVWNPVQALSKGWRFNLMDFCATADAANKAALIAWIENPVYL